MFSIIPIQYKILAVVLLVLGAAWYGYNKGTTEAELVIAKYAAEKKDLESKLKEEQGNIKEKIVTKYVDRVKVIKDKEYVYVKQAETVVPSQYFLSNGWLYLHDISARGDNADATRASDETSSGIKDNQALGTVTENYSICRQNSEQLIGLQNWIVENKQLIDELKKKNNK